MVVTFADTQAAVDAAHKPATWKVMIGGVITECTDVTTRHGVNEPIGTATLSLHLPLPAHVTYGATVWVQAGYPGAVGTIFRGTIPRYRGSISASGATATITASSYGARLSRKDYTDVVFNGPISLKKVFESLCKRRNALFYRSDATTAPNGTTTITFGNNEEANGKTLTIPRKTQTLDFLTRTAALFGYRVFDTPVGMRLKRVSGMPNEAAAIAIAEAWNAVTLESEHDMSGLVNYWEVFGDEYTDRDGVTVPIRSIANALPYEPLLADNGGWARDEISDSILDEYWLADIVRNVAEIDHSTPRETVAWETHGAPDLLPGDVVDVTSATLGASGLQWLMRVQHTISRDRGFRTRCEGWRGAGTALPAGEDCITTTIPGGPWHVGDETVPWYAVPKPNSGHQFTIHFTVQEYYSSLAIYGLAHGSNSQFIDSTNTDLTISRFEVWQNGEEVGRGDLPVLDENYAKKLPYGTSDTYWDRFVIPIGGSLEPGAAELRILSGENPDLASGVKWDNFEVKNLSLRTCGVGSPTMPEEVTT